MKINIITLLFVGCLLVSGCKSDAIDADVLWFSTTADYPPFEYDDHGELKGFDIELASLVAAELGKEARFKDLPFSSLLVAVQNEMVDAAIATITVTPERTQKFDFTKPYYFESLAMVTYQGQSLSKEGSLKDKKIACQMGTTMEYWLQAHAKEAQVTTTDTNPQAIEALKAGHVDGVLIDEVQARAFVKRNPKLSYQVFAQADTGYAIVVKKNSLLVEKMNTALESLERKGEIDKLKKKYLEGEL